MKRIRKYRKEHGAITLMTAFMLVVLLGFTALVADFGLRYVEGAKLQNAIDAAATAAASSIGNVDESIENTAYQYLALNGFDRDGDYKDKIDLDIETKGVVNLKTVEDDESYITAGFYKLTVTVEQNTLFASVLGVDSMKLQKTSYVRCKPKYVDMPKALNYTIFAGSTEGTENNPAIKVDGRTADWVNNTANFFERAINWTNSTIVQPIIGWFGGNPDYNELVHINLSEIVCNGDVHSNSNIRIGVQALNVSRVKDRDYEGINSAETNYGNGETATTSVDTKEINGGHDYGQVTFTAVDRIMFNNSLKNNHPSSTHVYVQNQQYLEETQDLLDVLDEIDYTKCKDTATLRQQFRKVLQTTTDPEDPDFVKTFWGRHTEIYRSEKRKQALLAQVDLIEYDPTSSNIYINYTGGRALLQSQNQIIYNVSQKAIDSEESGALGILQQFRQTADAYKNGTLTVENDFDKELSPQQKALLNWRNEASGDDKIDPIYKDSSDELMYANQADKKSDIDYDVLFSRKRTDANNNQVLGDDGLPIIDNLELNVQGTSVARNFTHLGNFTNPGNEEYKKAKEKTTNGVKFAVANTFQENSDYISMPNLKPYFTRQINNSVRNATKTKEKSGDSTAGDRNVKQAVDTKGKEYQDILKNHKFKTGEKDSENNDVLTYEDRRYNSVDKLKNASTTPLFSSTLDKSPTDGGQLTYLTGEGRTKFLGYDLYKNTGTTENPNLILKAPVDFVNEYFTNDLQGTGTDSNKKMGNAGKGAIDSFYNNTVRVQYFGKDNTGVSDTSTNADHYNAVKAKKNSIRTEQINKVKELHDTILRAKDGEEQSPYVKADNSIETNNESSEYGYAVMQAAAKRHIELEEKPDITQGEAQEDVEQVVFINDAKNAAYNIPNHTIPTFPSASSVISGISSWNSINFNYPKQRSTDDKLIRCNWNEEAGSDNNNHNFHRIWKSGEKKTSPGYGAFWAKHDDVYYGSGDDKIRADKYEGGRGFLVSAGTYFYANNFIKTGNTGSNNSYELSVRGTLYVGGGATTTNGRAVYVNDKIWIHDNAKFGVNGSVECVASNNRDGCFDVGSNATAIIEGELIAPKLNISSTSSKVTVNDNVTISGDLTNNGTLLVDGDLTVTGTFTNNGTIICNGSLSTGNAVLSGEGITYVGGSVNSGSSEYNISGRHKLYCEGTITVSDMSLNNSFVHAGNEFKTTNTSGQSLSLTNYSVLESLDRFEVIDYYVSGNSTLNVKVVVSFGEGKEVKYRNKQNYVFDGDQKAKLVDLGNCEIKINGDLTVTEGITLSGGTKLYVTGAVYCGGAITLSGGSGLYADRGVGVKTKDESADSDKVPTSITLTGGSVLLCRNDINATTLKNFIISTLTEIGNFLNIYRANITCNGPISADGGSKVYAEGRINTYATVAKNSSHIAGFYAINLNRDSSNGGKVEVEGKDSFVFCGEKSSTSNKPSLIANGQFYYPKSKIILTHLEVKMYGYAVMLGNVTISGTSNKDNPDFQISKTGSNAGTLYVDGVTKFGNCFINNGGNMYLVGGVDYGNVYRRGTIKENKKNRHYCDADFKTGSDSYIGQYYENGTTKDTFVFNSQYEARGNVYFENNLKVNNGGYIPSGETDTTGNTTDFPNRGVAVYIPAGMTYVSGGVDLTDDNALYIKGNTDTGLAIKDNLKLGCTIYDNGNLIVCQKIQINNGATYITDKGDNKYNQGLSIKIGESQSDTDATFYAGGAVDYLDDTKNGLRLVGYVRNYGKFYLDAPLSVQGYNNVSNGGLAGDVLGSGRTDNKNDYDYVVQGNYAYTNYAGAETHINGAVELNASRIFNKWNAVFACEGDLAYGDLTVNCGKLLVNGDMTNNITKRSASTYKAIGKYTVNDQYYNWGGWNTSNNNECLIGVSVINGLYQTYSGRGAEESADYYNENGKVKSDGNVIYPEATIYCAGTLQTGNKKYDGNKNNSGLGGSVYSIGKMYIGGALDIFTFDETVNGTGTKNSHFYNALWLYNRSETFVGGRNYNGAGAVIGNNSIFMCGGDFITCRAAKINARTYIATRAATSDSTRIETNTDDLYNPAYVYVGGDAVLNTFGRNSYEWGSKIQNIFSPCPQEYNRDLDVYSNTNMFVGGFFYANSKVNIKQNVKLLVGCAHKIIDSSDDQLKDKVFEAYTSGSIIERIKRAFWGGYDEANQEAADYRFFVYQSYDQGACSTVVALGNAIVKDTTKIRDMTTTYFYGNFRSINYFELGKALDGFDETEAKEPGFRSLKERNTIGNSQAKEEEFLKAYKFDNAPNMYIGGNFEVGGNVYSVLGVLRISKRYIKVFASSKLRVLGDVKSSSYITLRHDVRFVANGNVTAETSVDVGSYSHLICSGALKAKTSTMKIRDQVTVAVGGDCIALSYIELGKAGDFVRTNQTISKFTANETETKYEENKEGDEGYEGEVSEGTEAGEDGNGNENTGGENAQTGENSSSTGTENIGDTNIEYGTTLNTDTELTNDKTDPSLGGDFYIGGSLMTYTGYIKEFAYSFVSVGSVVFTPKYLTLRHNSDMWVLPELYKLYGDKDNKTYQYTPYIPTSDGSIWGDIKDFFGAIGHEVKETFSPHPGTIYTMGELTLNKNASLFGTYDAQVLGQCVLREDSLVYLGHDFNCNAPSVNISLDMIRGNTSVVGFDSYGKAGVGWKYTCKNNAEDGPHKGYDYTMTVRETEKPKSGYVKCDVCGKLLPASEAVKCQVSYPAVVYAYNNIDIDTTIQMRMTYLVANKGDVSMYNVYTKTENAEKNAKELPNAICSYLGHINYFGMYSKLGALFYAPTKSTKENVSWFESFKPENEQKKTKVDSITLDGYYNEIWGCIMGDTIDMSSYYLTLHRFENWRTMDLHVVESGNVFIIPQKKYDEAAPNVDDIYLNEKYRVENTELESEGARQFFIPGEYIPHSVTSH